MCRSLHHPSVAGLVAGAVVLSAASPASATFHLWAFQEVFSNDDGTVQFIELFTNSNSQQFATGEQFRSSQGGNINTYTFPNDTPAPTAGHHLLIATAAFAALPGAPTPDFIMPDGFLFAPNGLLENLSLGGPTYSYASLPTDGVLSLGPDGSTTAVNSPTNFAGDSGSIDVSAPDVPATSTWGLAILMLLVVSVGTTVIQKRRTPSLA